MNLEQQKKQARELLRAIRSGNSDALSRLRRQHSRWAVDDATVRQQVALHDAQFVLAREQGFASWTKLKAYAEPSPHSRHTRLFVADVAWIADRVRGLLRTRQSAGPAALEQIREWHPRFSDWTDDEIRKAEFTEADARLVYAREHGFETWDDLASRVNLLASGTDTAIAEPFMAAFRALESGKVADFDAVLRANPRLAHERGTNGNTLLNLAVSFAGKPDWKGGVSPVEALLAGGADVNDANDRGWTPLHQAAYTNNVGIAGMLVAKGAALDAEAHGAGGTPLVVALFWGHREVADLIGSYGVAPGNLRTAAGLGSIELLEALFRDERTLLPEAALPADFTVRTAAFQIGNRPTIRKRFSTRRSFGHRRAAAWLFRIACCERGPTSMPTLIEAPHSFGRRPVTARRPPHGYWIMAPTSTRRPHSVG